MAVKKIISGSKSKKGSAEKETAKKAEKPPRTLPASLATTREPDHRPATKSKFSMDLVRRICENVGNGVSLHQVLDSDKKTMPSRTSFFQWVREKDEVRAMYEEALAARAEKFADEITQIADEAATDEPEYTNAHRLRVDARKWVAARLLPKKYGDKIIHSGDAENPLVTQLVLAGNDLAAKIRGGGK